MRQFLTFSLLLSFFISTSSYAVYLKYIEDDVVQVRIEEWTDQTISQEKNLKRLIFKAKSYCSPNSRGIASVKTKVVDYWVKKPDGSDYLKPIMQVKLRCILP